MERLEDSWARVLDILETEITMASFDLWVKPLEIVDLKDGVLYLGTTSETTKQRLMKMHADQIKKAMNSIRDDFKDFKLLSPDEKEEYLLESRLTQNNADSNNVLCTFNPKYTFDSFVVGNSNKFVFAAAQGVAQNPVGKINPLFIYGGSGLGKTHLLHSIGNYIRKNFPTLKVLYVTCENFTNDYVESLKSGKDYANSKFREKYRNLDVLMIDDIQFISNKTSTQEEFFHTFNDLYQNNKQIVIASDRPPKDIATLEERLKSRFSMGLIQDVQSPDFETRLAILQKKAQEENFSVNDDVLNYIAENCDTNIREIEGLLGKVFFYAGLLGKSTATIEDAMEALKDHVSSTKLSLTSDRIIDCVCKYFSVTRDDLLGKKKSKEIVEPRQICMYIICEMLDLPLKSIGNIFGKKDHTTIMYARDKVSEMVKENNRIRVIVEDIKSMASLS